MKKKKIKFLLWGLLVLILFLIAIYRLHEQKKEETLSYQNLEATVLTFAENTMTVQDKDHSIYTFPIQSANIEVGDHLFIEYSGILDSMLPLQKVKVVSYQEIPVSNDEDGIPIDFQDQGLFKDFYILANNQLKKMTLKEKIGQLLLVRYPDTEAANALKNQYVSGFIFFEKDFQDKTPEEVKKMMEKLQSESTIPLLMAVDEEGGKVIRVSSNPRLVSSPFRSSRDLYQDGGFDLIAQDTILKSAILKELGINLNLAPVVDVSTNSGDYMYERSLGQSTALTSQYAKTVIASSKGTGVSYTLKHFPGYGNNQDTHLGQSKDNRSYEDIKKNDLPPFEAGIEEGAEAVLVSHNTVTNIDSTHPASLSSTVHNILRNDLHFTGIIMTDDLSMGATSSIDNVVVKALLSGNDLLIVTDYQKSFQAIEKAVQDQTVSEESINRLAFRVLAWKYYKGLMFENHK